MGQSMNKKKPRVLKMLVNDSEGKGIKLGLLDKIPFGRFKGTLLCRLIVGDIYYVHDLIQKGNIIVDGRVDRSVRYELAKRGEGTTLNF